MLDLKMSLEAWTCDKRWKRKSPANPFLIRLITPKGCCNYKSQKNPILNNPLKGKKAKKILKMSKILKNWISLFAHWILNAICFLGVWKAKFRRSKILKSENRVNKVENPPTKNLAFVGKFASLTDCHWHPPHEHPPTFLHNS